MNPNFPEEEGRKRVSGFQEDHYKFRVPSLRNIELTFPYMHDGRFGTLEAVMDFYANGMVANGTIDPSLVDSNGSLGIPLSITEKENIIAFLKTLTDNEFIEDKRFAEF